MTPTEGHREEAGEKLAEALDAWQPSGAEAPFRAALRERFVAARGEVAEVIEPDLQLQLQPRPELAHALDALESQARAEFRSELRERFLGEATSAKARSAPVRKRPAGSSRSRARGAGREAAPSPGRRSRLRIVGAGVATLAAAAALVLWLMPTTPRWAIDPEGLQLAGLIVDDDPIPAGTDLATLGGLLARAKSIQVAAEPARLVYGDLFVVELEYGAELDLQAVRDTESGSPFVLEGDAGSYRIATGPGFDKERGLEFRTPRVDVAVVGTVFGVDCAEEFTCVCCFEGTVRTTPHLDGYEEKELEELETHVHHKDAPLTELEGYESHQQPLERLSEFWDRWPTK